jgi:hemerythrin-like domain-containing protein
MCNYCGCRAFPLIGRLTEEHDAIADIAGELHSAIKAGRHDEATQLLDELIGLLIPHTSTEEQGLFAELRFDSVLAEEVDKLCREHADIHGVLMAADRTVPDWSAVLAAIPRLYRHIDNEEYGLFPAAVIALPMPAWDRITDEVETGALVAGVVSALSGRRDRWQHDDDLADHQAHRHGGGMAPS